MSEAELKAKLCNYMRDNIRGSYVIRHEDKFTHGIPDISVSSNKVTTWVEVKFADPRFRTKGVQDFNLLRLSVSAHSAFYVVYYSHRGDDWTYIVQPGGEIDQPRDSWQIKVPGLNHAWVSQIVQEINNDKRRS